MTDFYDDDDDDLTFDCPSCGAAVYEDSPRCPQCGDYVTNASSSGLRSRWWFVVIVIVLVALMLWPFLAGLLSV